MALNTTQQIYESVKQSKSPLITFKKEFNTDILASSIAIALWLKKLDKKAEIVCHNFAIPENMGFLPLTDIIKKELNNLRKFVIDLDISETEVDKFSYKVEGDKLRIFITPKNGEFSNDQVALKNSNYKHDLIFTLNTPDLESLSEIYETNPDFFYNTPIVNVCNLPENEHYGQINMVSLTATSISEILYDLFYDIDSALVDEHIATALLTGMIDQTKSFKDSKVTPKSLNIASQLVAAGAQREDIIKNLYQTKKVSTLKLWGTILNKLQTDDKQKIAWSRVTSEDFKATRTTSKDLIDIIEELITSIPTIELSAIFFQTDNSHTHCIVKAEKNINLLENLSEFKPQGTQNLIRFAIDTKDFENAEEQVHEYLKNLV